MSPSANTNTQTHWVLYSFAIYEEKHPEDPYVTSREMSEWVSDSVFDSRKPVTSVVSRLSLKDPPRFEKKTNGGSRYRLNDYGRARLYELGVPTELPDGTEVEEEMSAPTPEYFDDWNQTLDEVLSEAPKQSTESSDSDDGEETQDASESEEEYPVISSLETLDEGDEVKINSRVKPLEVVDTDLEIDEAVRLQGPKGGEIHIKWDDGRIPGVYYGGLDGTREKRVTEAKVVSKAESDTGETGSATAEGEDAPQDSGRTRTNALPSNLSDEDEIHVQRADRTEPERSRHVYVPLSEGRFARVCKMDSPPGAVTTSKNLTEMTVSSYTNISDGCKHCMSLLGISRTKRTAADVDVDVNEIISTPQEGKDTQATPDTTPKPPMAQATSESGTEPEPTSASSGESPEEGSEVMTTSQGNRSYTGEPLDGTYQHFSERPAAEEQTESVDDDEADGVVADTPSVEATPKDTDETETATAVEAETTTESETPMSQETSPTGGTEQDNERLDDMPKSLLLGVLHDEDEAAETFIERAETAREAGLEDIAAAYAQFAVLAHNGDLSEEHLRILMGMPVVSLADRVETYQELGYISEEEAETLL